MAKENNSSISEIEAVTVAPEPVARVPKDNWDKLAAVAPIVSGALIFLMGGYFTYSYNQQQLRLQEIQTIERFIPHLMGNNQSKRAAILAISSLTNAELASKFAQIFASQGTVSALQSIAETGSDKEKTVATTALAQALENLAARESRLNEMESAFQKALGDKQTMREHGSRVEAEQLGLDELDEASKLEKLAQMCRERGQTGVAESLLRQAQLIRGRHENREKEEKPPAPPLPAPQAEKAPEEQKSQDKLQSVPDSEKTTSELPVAQ